MSLWLDNHKTISVTFKYALATSPVSYCKVIYTVHNDGLIDVELSLDKDSKLPPLPEFGIMFNLDKKYDYLTWYGLGPQETYSDRKLSGLVGLYKGKVDEQLAELNYLQSYNLSKTEGKTDFDPEFEKHEEEERQHKYDFINRLRELDSSVIFMPIDQWVDINSCGTEWKQEMSSQSSELIKNRLEEEKHAVEFYGLCVDFLRGKSDSTTYTLFKKVKEDEEEHIKDLRDLARDHGFLGTEEK